MTFAVVEFDTLPERTGYRSLPLAPKEVPLGDKGRAGVGMGLEDGGIDKLNPTPILAFPLRGKGYAAALSMKFLA